MCNIHALFAVGDWIFSSLVREARKSCGCDETEATVYKKGKIFKITILSLNILTDMPV